MKKYNNLILFICMASLIVLLLLPGSILANIAKPVGVTPENFNCAQVVQIPNHECEALVAIYNDLQGSQWNQPEAHEWLQSYTPCGEYGSIQGRWSGIFCSDGHVVSISFYYTVGSIPSAFTHFGAVGVLPAEIENLTHLESLYLGRNQISGLPIEIGNLSNLQALNLNDNQLTYLPPEIGI